MDRCVTYVSRFEVQQDRNVVGYASGQRFERFPACSTGRSEEGEIGFIAADQVRCGRNDFIEEGEDRIGWWAILDLNQ